MEKEFNTSKTFSFCGFKNSNSRGVFNTSAFKNPWFYVSVVVVLVLLIVLFKPTSNDQIQQAKQTQPNIPNNVPIVQISEDNDAILGDPNAPVTIIEFSDYECPFCSRFYFNTLPALKKAYINTGKVKLIFRDFPLGFHPNAQKAAEATEAARQLGGDEKFWEMHDKLFENQRALTQPNLIKYAEEIGLDKTEFKELLDLSTFRNEVLADSQDGQQAGVQGTPTFYINGKQLVGAQPFEAFQQIIEGELQ